MNIQLKEMNFFNVVPMIDDFYNVLSTNRARLEPWFWWASSKVTPNKFKYALFMLLYLANTKRRKIAHKFDHKQIYDEQFIINVDGEFGGGPFVCYYCSNGTSSTRRFASRPSFVLLSAIDISEP